MYEATQKPLILTVRRIERDRRIFGALLVIGALIIGTAVVAPFYLSRHERSEETGEISRLIITHDLVMHLPQTQAFYSELQSGIIYPRWLADTNKGYGLATPIFYPPGMFYSLSIFYSLLGDWVDALFAISILGVALSGLLLYLLSRMFFSRAASIIAAVFYMVLPFRMLNLYWQGALPQFLGFMFLPAMLYFVIKVGTGRGARYYAGLGLIYGLYLLTHLPVAYLFTYTLAIYAITWAFIQRDWRIAARIAGGMALGLMLSAIYWLPAALEAKYVYEWASDLLPYHRTYITLLESESKFYMMINYIFLLQVGILICAVIIIKMTGKRDGLDQSPEDDISRVKSRLWIIMGIVTTLFNTSFSIYVSKLIPKIQVASPAWRWLAISSFFTTILLAAAIDRSSKSLNQPVRRAWAWRGALAVLVLLTAWFSIQHVIIPPLSHPTYHPPKDYITTGFIPKDSTPPDQLPDVPLARIQPSTGAAEVTRWDPQDREVLVSISQESELSLKTYNFPGWTATIDGQPAPILSDENGVQLIKVPEGIHRIKVSFVNTPPRTFGTAISGLAFLAIAGLFVAGQIRVGKHAAPFEEKEQSDLVIPKNKRPTGRIILIGSICIIAASIIIVALNKGRSNKAVDRAPAPSANRIDVGAEAMLYAKQWDSLPIAVDRQALAEMVDAISRKDSQKLESLHQSGKVFSVDNSTRVRILEAEYTKAKVRVLEGDKIMLEGWVMDTLVR